MAGEEPPRRPHDEAEMAFRTPGPGVLGEIRDEVPAEIREPSFATSVRGYDRRGVDAYVERVNRLIAELQLGGSPKAAVRHALDRAGEQTTGILLRARETADEITTAAGEEAEQLVARATAEAANLVTRAQQEAGEALSDAKAEAAEIVTAAKREADEVLTRATDEAERTVARARRESEARLRTAEEEIASRHEQAESRMRSLQAGITATEEERRAQLEEIRRLAGRLEELVAGDEAIGAGAPGAESKGSEPVTPIEEQSPGRPAAEQAGREQPDAPGRAPEP